MEKEANRFYTQMNIVPSAIILSVAIGTITWLVSYLNIFMVLEGFIYDHILIRFSQLTRAKPAQVLLIEASKFTSPNDRIWLPLLKKIEALQPKQVLFMFLPEDKDLYDAAKRYGNVIFGRKIKFHRSSSDQTQLEPWPQQVQDLEPTYGVIKRPGSRYGIYRWQKTQYQVNESFYPTIETVAAQKAGINKTRLLDKHYYIHFLSDERALPILTLSQAQNGNLIPELVKDKIVMIGFNPVGGNTLVTPLIAENQLITPLQFHGYALQTLLSRQSIQWAGPISKLMLMVLITFISLVLFQWLSVKFAFLLLFGFILIHIFCAWFVLAYFHLWLPVSAIWFSQALAYLFFARHLLLTEENAIWDILLHTSGKFLNKCLPEIYASDQYWSQVAVMVTQTLNLECTLFLECVEGTHCLKETKALNCELDDICERRRDYHRAPYKTAAEQNAPVRVDNFLKTVQEDEVQYLIPLSFLGDVLGFWVFTVKSKYTLDDEKTAFVNKLAEQISELLFYHKEWLQQKEQMQRSFTRYLYLHGKQNITKQLETILSLMERRLIGLEDYLQAQSTASMLFDFFGRIIVMNQRMQHILGRENLHPYDMTALDLLMRLTGINNEEGKQTLQKLIIEGKEFTFNITLSKQYDNPFRLRVAAVHARDDEARLREEHVMGAERIGFLYELIPVSEPKHS